jgi:hypothetical protein
MVTCETWSLALWEEHRWEWIGSVWEKEVTRTNLNPRKRIYMKTEKIALGL